MTRGERGIASAWTILASFLFVVVQWNNIDLQSGKILLSSQALLGWKTGWFIFIGVCIAVLTANIAIPLIPKLKPEKRRLVLLVASVVTNLSILGFFKYFNFFIESMEAALKLFNLNPAYFKLDLILPVGISFYTFQTMSYTIDIYRKKLKPTENFLDFALFVAYFPQLVAGPIERAVNLLPRISTKRTITLDQTLRGLHLIFYGLFKKVVIADGVARTVNQVYGSTGHVTWLDIVAATTLFAIQIYCDFSGYSDIARGTSKLFGIDLMVNFNLPYFAKIPREFWSRWHISLSTWLRDYLYIPLGGNRNGKRKTHRNLFITMILGGLWHGAAWNFVLWGFYHGAVLSIHRKFFYPLKDRQKPDIPLKSAAKIAIYFIITLYGWLLFRSQSFGQIAALSSTLLLDFGNLTLTSSYPRAAALFGLPIFLL